MAYDEGLAERVREVLSQRDELAANQVVEKRMFGGLAFMVRGHMCCGVAGDQLMVRVGPDAYSDCLQEPYAREMDFTGRPLKGMVYVDEGGIESDPDLARWIDRGLSFVLSLPPK